MQKAYYVNNRKRLYQHMDAGSLLAIFSGEELWKCGDEYFPFFCRPQFCIPGGTEMQVRRAACREG